MNEIKIEVWGDFACFSRPESKVERLTYPVITPSAARGILSAVYSKPVEFYWQIRQMGKLATMAQYHLSKLKGEQQGLYVFFSRQLEEISCKIGTSLPKTFSLNEQSEFALGYYFQRAERSASKKMEE